MNVIKSKKNNLRIISKSSEIFSSEIAIVCPTKNQHRNVGRLLDSLRKQTKKPFQIIVSESGTPTPEVIEKYISDLNIIYLKSPYMGQVLQRNYAYSYLDKKIKVVINLDDDITLHEDSLENFLICWNIEKPKAGLPLGGMSLNVVDAEIPKDSIYRKIFYMGISEKGGVSKAGYAATYFPTLKVIETEWLIGGATGWERSIIENHKHPIDFSTHWAVCEDLIYSYPLHHSYRLIVAKDAHVNHNQTYSEMSLKKGIYYGLSLVIMRFYFVSINKDLSIFLFFWMTLGQLVAYMLMSFRGDHRSIGFFLGGVKGIILCLLTVLGKGSSKELAKRIFNKS